MTDDPGYAPSEEFILYCDIEVCPASLSMVADIPRSAHGWGRATVYGDDGTTDYDLCTVHFTELRRLLKGTPDG